MTMSLRQATWLPMLVLAVLTTNCATTKPSRHATSKKATMTQKGAQTKKSKAIKRPAVVEVDDLDFTLSKSNSDSYSEAGRDERYTSGF